ncbi:MULTISPECIES: sensor histidine kinase [Sphingobacterium]|uniref:histidine kinase n=1 Tax=Sphingobacterium hotanense TaxID=649196 RepID=A0ABT7NRH8_9SPHI|nr:MULTISPECIES: ATP-binding protein [Sphingobacterium]MDM1049856.1 GHKL domain-containing protein [Sphingobacterium hotanense]
MRKALFLFYFLIFYAITQLLWWGYILIKFEPERKGMIIGEGLIFMLIFIWGALKLKKQVKREHEINTQQQNFLLAVTHELKSPLASVKLYIQTILKRELDREQQKVFLSNSLKDIERLDDLVENVLLSTKLENRAYQLPKEVFDMSDLVEQIIDRLQKNACKTQVIKADLDEHIKLKADKFAITNVITNLVENAVKYSPACGMIYVKLKEEGGNLIFSVADHGIGIPDEEKRLIFNKFYRVGSEATRKTKGTGLGLYIVRTVLQKHNASIRVKDNKPSGSIFEVTFENYAN